MAHKYEKKIACFDLDGTLLDSVEAPSLGAKRNAILLAVQRLRELGFDIHINTSRTNVQMNTDEVRAKTGIFDVFGGKPIADVFFDDRGLLPPADLIDGVAEIRLLDKDELYSALAGGKLKSKYAENVYNAPENQTMSNRVNDNSFRVYIPFSAGMDSTTLFNMAVESGYPVIPVYMNMGQPGASEEIKTAKRLLSDLGFDGELEVVDLPMEFKTYDYILLGRNAIIIFYLAELMNSRGQWGEIWFGNLAGESPIYGGDKSRKFFNDTQLLLAYTGYNVHLINPLMGMDKPDEVTYWSKRDINILKNTRSCLDDNAEHACGKCQSCFKKWCAFDYNNIDITGIFESDIRVGFLPFVDKYEKVLNKALTEQDFSHYSPAKCKEILTCIEHFKALK